MCFVINKWRDFKTTKEYLDVVSKLNTVLKLKKFVEQIKWQGETGDYWMTPVEFLKNKDQNIDCEDFSIFAVDVLVRIIGIEGARLVIQSGYNKARWGNKIWNVKCHAIAVFPWQGKIAVFDNGKLKVGYKSIIEAGYITFPDGLKYQLVIDDKGEILEKRSQLFGTF